MSDDLNKIYETLGSLKASITHIHVSVDEIKKDNKDTQAVVRRHEKIVNRIVGYCIACSVGAGTIATFIPKTIAGLLK